MVKEKACKQCKAIYEGAKCPMCGHDEGNEGFKGKVMILDIEQSEIAKCLKLTKKGMFAVKA
jgi:DNA-directed RNA polymerase subunit E"